MKNPKGGRPKKFEKEELLKILLNYVEKHPNQTIKLYELEATTGIKRYVWSYNLKDEIDKINKEIQKVHIAENGWELPSVEQILLSCNGDEDKLALQLQTLLDMVQDLSRHQESSKAMQKMKTDYENKLKEKDNKIEKLYAQINKLVIDSDNSNKCIEQNIKNNVLQLTPENLELFKARATKLLV